MDIVQGMHSIHLYAQEYWIEHLLAYLDSRSLAEIHPMREQILSGRLDILVELFQSSFSMQSIAVPHVKHTRNKDQRARLVQGYPGLAAIIEHRHNIVTRQESDGAFVHGWSTLSYRTYRTS